MAKSKGKGKAKKGDKQREPPRKEYTLISLEEVRAREAKYLNRLSALNACLNVVYEAILSVHHLNEIALALEKWNSYVRCDNLPKPYIPPEIRLFFVKLLYFENENVEKTIDWQLSIDERSILSQNIFRKDCTRRTLINEIRPNFGSEYEKDIDVSLKILKSIYYYLDNDEMVAMAPLSVLTDIIGQKKEVQKSIRELFDRYSYRILSSEDAYMNDVDAITAEYFYAGKHFQVHIWTLKNVPILFEFFEVPYIIAKLHNLKLSLQIPFNVLESNLTLRALHTNFDHYSEHAKSFEQIITTSTGSNLNAGIQDLYECLVNEWNMQVEIQTTVRNEMAARRQEYEELKAAAEAEAKNKKKDDKNENAKKPKKKKEMKEPPIITNDTYPDIWDDFVQQEQKQFENFIDSVYHPNVLKLSADEVNLKKYLLLGGIYQMFFVEKMRHYNFNTFNMTWHRNDGNLFFKKDVVCDRKIMSPTRSMRASSVSSAVRISEGGRPSRNQMKRQQSTIHSVQDQMSEEIDPNTSPLFIITFDLPAHLCLWGVPKPCHYESDVIGYIEEEPLPKAPDPELVVKEKKSPKRGIRRRSSMTSLGTASLNSVEIGGDNPGGVVIASSRPQRATQVASETKKANFAATSAAAAHATAAASNRTELAMGVSKMSVKFKRPQSVNVFRPSMSNLALLKNQESEKSLVLIKNFSIEFQLLKENIRNIQRHCVPRMLSSFKFPIEIIEEETEQERNKPKGKGGTLIRRHRTDDEWNDSKANHKFTHDDQNNPERLFPVFSPTEPLDLEILRQSCYERNSTPETFFELINVLDNIKTLYRNDIKKILNAPEFISKVKVSKLIQSQLPSDNKKIDDMKRKESLTKRKSTTRGSVRSIASQMSKSAVRRLTITSQATIDGMEVAYESSASDEEVLEVPKRKTYTYAHWTTKHIIHSVFDKANSRITVWTDRLGIIAFAYKRYEHFPFRNWTLEPSPDNPDSEVIFTIDTQYVTCILKITSDGYRGFVTESAKKFVRNRAMYLEIKEPLTDFKELKRLFREKNVNIFSEHDARFYIENGYFSEKHLAAELHTYSCMSIHSTQIKFSSSSWNRLAKRRDLVFNFRQRNEPEENTVCVRITPEDATFVDIKELCSDNLNEIKLQYTLTWRNIDYYADLHHLIISMYPASNELRVKNPQLICCMKNLLCAIRPLSFS